MKIEQPDIVRGLRITVVSQYLPTDGAAGHTAYLGSIVGALHEGGANLTVLLVDPWPGPVLRRPPEWMAVRGPSVVRIAGRVITIAPRAITANLAATGARHAPASMRRALVAHRDRHRDRRAIDQVVARPLRAATECWLRRHLDRTHPDLVVVNGHSMGTAWCPPGMRILAITHDSIVDRVQRLAAAGYRPVPRSFDVAAERQLLDRCSGVTAIQSNEGEYFQRLLPGSTVIVVPPALPVPVVRDGAGDGRTVLFVGTMSLHNVDGARWLIDEVWPAVTRAAPDMRLRIVGTVGDRVRVDRPDVSVTGRVDDLAAEYAAASVVVVPLRVGSGLKMKAVEALLHGCRVVTTEVGAEGLGTVTGVHLEVADDAQSFADAIVGLAARPDDVEARRARSLAPGAEFGGASTRRALFETIGAVMASGAA